MEVELGTRPTHGLQVSLATDQRFAPCLPDANLNSKLAGSLYSYARFFLLLRTPIPVFLSLLLRVKSFGPDQLLYLVHPVLLKILYLTFMPSLSTTLRASHVLTTT